MLYAPLHKFSYESFSYEGQLSVTKWLCWAVENKNEKNSLKSIMMIFNNVKVSISASTFNRTTLNLNLDETSWSAHTHNSKFIQNFWKLAHSWHNWKLHNHLGQQLELIPKVVENFVGELNVWNKGVSRRVCRGIRRVFFSNMEKFLQFLLE